MNTRFADDATLAHIRDLEQSNASLAAQVAELKAEQHGVVIGAMCAIEGRCLSGEYYGEIRELSAQVAELRRALEKVRPKHHQCGDPWYSCPKSQEGCADDGQGQECNCGAEDANAVIDAVLSLPIPGAVGRMEAEANSDLVECIAGALIRHISADIDPDEMVAAALHIATYYCSTHSRAQKEQEGKCTTS